MNIQVVGLNHKSAPIEIREKISFSSQGLSSALISLKSYDFIEEGLILSTCNRVEVYTVVKDAQKGSQATEKFLSAFHRVDKDIFKKHLYVLHNLEAVRHLFKVASSLDSMIIGETQIAAQVKDAYLQAKELRCAGAVLSRLFEEALRIGKKVRAETQIGKGAVSISSAAIELAKKIFKSLKDRKVLIIGAGKIAELAVTNLYSKGVKTVLVANRTFTKAQGLARLFGGLAVKFERLFEHIQEADILISSTSAPHFILKKQQIQKIMQERKHRCLFIIDLGLPRNVSPDVSEIKNVHLYNLDDLTDACDANLKERLSGAQEAERIIEKHLWYHLKEVIPLGLARDEILNSAYPLPSSAASAPACR